MAKQTYTGSGDTFESAFEAAAEAAFKARTKPANPDEMFLVKVESMSAIYGTIVGYAGQRQVEVSLDAQSDHVNEFVAAGAAPGAAKLVLKLDVMPDHVTVDLEPPVRRPQPHQIGLVLTVHNIGSAAFVGQSMDSALARFGVMRSYTPIWSWPEIVNQVVTPVRIEPGQSLTFMARWQMPDAVDLVGADLTAVGRFMPTLQAAHHAIVIDAVH
ncbi:MAG: hypothetical protein U0638_12600 [Phycisphaerales bacterium]